MVYWAVAACLKTIGWNLWAVRLPTAVCALDSAPAGSFICLPAAPWVSRSHRGPPSPSRRFPSFLRILFRTAMLDMPLLFLVFLTAYGLTCVQNRNAGTVVAGLAAGSAILVKGGAGLLAIFALLACGLARRGPRGVVLRETARALLLAALPFLAYLAMFPADLRSECLRAMTAGEGAGHVIAAPIAVYARALASPIDDNVRWHVPAAALGFLLLLAGLVRRPAWRAWAWLGLLVRLPYQ